MQLNHECIAAPASPVASRSRLKMNRSTKWEGLASFSTAFAMEQLGTASLPRVREMQLTWTKGEWQKMLDGVERADPNRSETDLTKDRAYAQAHLIAAYLSRKHGMLTEFIEYTNTIGLGFNDGTRETFGFEYLEERWAKDEILKTDDYTIKTKSY